MKFDHYSFFMIVLLITNTSPKEYHLITSNGHPSQDPYLTFSSKFKEQCISICGTTRKCHSYTIKQTSSNQFECQFYDRATMREDLVRVSHQIRYYINARDCDDWYNIGARASGVYKVNWMGRVSKNIRCNMEIEGGGWIVFHRRYQPITLDFQRPWNDYKSGFGDPHREFWLGNDFIHEMTASGKHDFLAYAKNYTGETEISRYGDFYIENEIGNYTIHFNETLLAGMASLTGERNLNGKKFHTYDRDHGSICISTYLHGPFWFKDCTWLDPNRPDYLRWNHYTGNNDLIQEIQLMFKATGGPLLP